MHTFHFGNYPYDAWDYHLMEGLCARAVDRLIAVGLEQRLKIQAAYRLSDSRIGMIWNGVTPAVPISDGLFRTKVGTGNRLLIGTVAKLIEQKGLDDLLRVALACSDAGHRMQFVIVGEGPLRPLLEQRRRELGLEDTVVITGWIPNAAGQALPEFDVFFQPSLWEAMSIAILEAMAAGKAIVATRVGDNPHVLEDGVSGILVDSGDIEGMVDALVRVGDRRASTHAWRGCTDEVRAEVHARAHDSRHTKMSIVSSLAGERCCYPRSQPLDDATCSTSRRDPLEYLGASTRDPPRGRASSASPFGDDDSISREALLRDAEC